MSIRETSEAVWKMTLHMSYLDKCIRKSPRPSKAAARDALSAAQWMLPHYEKAKALYVEDVRPAFTRAIPEAATFLGISRNSYHAIAMALGYQALLNMEYTADPFICENDLPRPGVSAEAWHSRKKEVNAHSRAFWADPTAATYIANTVKRWSGLKRASKIPPDRDWQWFMSMIGTEGAIAAGAAIPEEWVRPGDVGGISTSALRKKGVCHDGATCIAGRVRRRPLGDQFQYNWGDIQMRWARAYRKT